MRKGGKRHRGGTRAESDGKDEPRLLKWVGGATAIISLVIALQQVMQLVSDGRERQRQITELERIAGLQRDARNYKGAWASFERALEVAEPGGQLAKLTGQLSDQRRALREAQERLAMVWLENLRVNAEAGESFSDAVGTLDPVLTRGIASGSGEHKADLLAHVGWAGFLRWRDGERRLNPDEQYAQALAIDSGNPYAHAYRAHWMLWTQREAAMREAKEHFVAALASGRVTGHVRGIQLAALRNLSSDGEAEFIAAVNDMRVKKETIDPQARSDLYAIYSFACGLRYDGDRFARFSAAVPVADQLATFQALFFGADKGGPDDNPRPGADACLAHLLEAAGQPEQALLVWTTLAETFPPKDGNRLGDRAREGVERLRGSRGAPRRPRR